MRIDAATAEKLRPWFPDLDFDSVRLVESWPTRFFVKNILNQGAMTIAPFIFYGKSSFDPDRPGSVALLAHELKHVEQYREMGRFRFFLRYFVDKARNGFKYSRDLPLERVAYDLQKEVLKKLEEDG
jgi:hypothetical protein